jgi:hypothetical protein
MANGQQLSKQNIAIFAAWATSRTDEDFQEMTRRGVLSRKVIATECGFAKSALDQNPAIKTMLRDLEDQLRARGVLPPATEKTAEAPENPTTSEPNMRRAAQDSERVLRLETDNASLKAEAAELKRALERHTILSEALAHTGRVPR